MQEDKRQDRVDVDEVSYDEDPGLGAYEPSVFDLLEHKTRHQVALLALASFTVLAILALVIGATVTTTPTSVKILLGVVGISASLTGGILRRNNSKRHR
jgi:hypothetical protein